MTKEDIINKDIVKELKDMQEENEQDHLEPVNVVIGRFQPFSIGHLSMSKELEKINGLPSVYIYIRSKSGKNSKFSDKLTINYMEDVVKGQYLVKDAWSMSASFIPVVIKETQRRGYNPVLIGAGEDRAKSYTSMVKRMKDLVVHPDFAIQELKGRLTSGTEVRQSIMDDDKKKFMKLVPKQVQPYYKQLKDELEKAGELVESLSVEDIVMDFDTDIDTISNILESYDENLFSDDLIIESILDYELNESKIKYTKGKTYQSGKGWTVYKNDDEVHISIDVTPSAGWQTDPHYTSELRFMDSGKRRGTFKIKSGNIDKMAKEMYNIGTKDNNEYYGLTPKDYGDIIRLSIDMENHIGTINEGKMGEIHLLAQDAKDFDEFKKEVNKEYPKLKDSDIKKIFKDVSNMKSGKLKESKKSKLTFKENYPVYHATYGGSLDAIKKYVESAGYKIDEDEFSTVLGDAFFKPKKGKTLKQTLQLENNKGEFIGNLHVQIYNRGTEGNPYELNVYTDQIKRGLKESNINEREKFVTKVSGVKTKEDAVAIISESFGDEGLQVFEHLLTINTNALIKSHKRLFERAIMFRNGEIDLDVIENRAERNTIPYLSKLDETKLVKFREALNEMVSPEYETKIDAAICGLVKTNRPVVWEDFKLSMIRSDFFKKDFKPFLMLQGLSDYQIDMFVENILRVKYQLYTNFFLGNCGLAYTFKTK